MTRFPRRRKISLDTGYATRQRASTPSAISCSLPRPLLHPISANPPKPHCCLCPLLLRAIAKTKACLHAGRGRNARPRRWRPSARHVEPAGIPSPFAGVRQSQPAPRSRQQVPRQTKAPENQVRFYHGSLPSLRPRFDAFYLPQGYRRVVGLSRMTADHRTAPKTRRSSKQSTSATTNPTRMPGSKSSAV